MMIFLMVRSKERHIDLAVKGAESGSPLTAHA